jgi:hypothetical protein
MPPRSAMSDKYAINVGTVEPVRPLDAVPCRSYCCHAAATRNYRRRLTGR